MFEILKSVEVEKFEVVELMLKTTPLFGVPVADVRIERSPKGLVVPIPRAPLLVKVEVPVAPKDAPFAVRTFEKSVVPVALVRVRPPLNAICVLVAFPGKRYEKVV